MLTSRQQQLLDFLRSYHRSTGVMPSTRDIQQHFGFASQTAAVSHLRALERKNVIKKLPGKARALVFPEDLNKPESLSISVVGINQTAGSPAEGQVSVDAALLGLSRSVDTFALRVKGDSMINAHILPGDYAVLEKRDAQDGDIVATQLNGETTLKRFISQDGQNYFKAENDAKPDLIPITEQPIQGVLVGLVRPARHAYAYSAA